MEWNTKVKTDNIYRGMLNSVLSRKGKYRTNYIQINVVSVGTCIFVLEFMPNLAFDISFRPK